MEEKEMRCGRGYIEVDLNQIRDNAEAIGRHISDQTKMIGVVKTDGYGHGSIPIAKALEGLPCMCGFAVATEEEALELRDAGISLPVMILGYTFPYAYEEMAQKGIEAAVFREDMLEQMGKAARKVGRNMRVHIKVDTGMGRIGVTPDESGLRFAERAMHTEGIEVAGIFTHFARADETDKTSAYGQLHCFEAFTKRVQQLGKGPILRHCSNSAGLMELPEADMDAVRAGIILYGLPPSAEVDMSRLPLRPALSFYSTVVFVKDMPAGCPISYGGTFVTPGPMRVATVPLGYGDGYPRSLSGRGYVLIRGQRAPILGRVCMDQMMVDVSHIPGTENGDRVTLIGCDGGEEISVQQLGDLSGRFHYELVCDLGKRVPRRYI